MNPINRQCISHSPRIGLYDAFKVSCPAGMVCTDARFCNAAGVQTQNVIELTPAEELQRVPLLSCKLPRRQGGFEGFCCHDPFYQDPWPNGNGAGCPGRNFVSIAGFHCFHCTLRVP